MSVCVCKLEFQTATSEKIFLVGFTAAIRKDAHVAVSWVPTKQELVKVVLDFSSVYHACGHKENFLYIS